MTLDKLKEHIEKIKNILTEMQIKDQNEEKIEILEQSGTVFYTSYLTLLNPNGVYIIGTNPGGNPDEENISDKENNKIKKSLENFINKGENYNAYLDDDKLDDDKEDWGKSYYQEGIKKTFEILGIDLKMTCGSNIVFQRSKNEKEINKFKDDYIYVHNYIINKIINPSVIIAIGNKPYYTLINHWKEKKEEIIINTPREDNNKLVFAAGYTESEDGDKLLCHLPHFSYEYLYKRFSKCETAKKELCRKINEKVNKWKTLSDHERPKWNFGITCEPSFHDK